MASNEKKKCTCVKITKDGPYIVSGDIPLNEYAICEDTENKSAHGDTLKKTKDFEPEGDYALCRCGDSENKPFCDGSHVLGFDGTETASKEAYLDQAVVYEGAGMDLLDACDLCSAVEFCSRAGGVRAQLFKTDSEAGKNQFIEDALNCLGGRLTPRTKDGKIIESDLPEEISVIIDCFNNKEGPLWIKNNIEVIGVDGTSYEKRNRVTLCRCGESMNKPFCDGQHLEESKAELT